MERTSIPSFEACPLSKDKSEVLEGIKKLIAQQTKCTLYILLLCIDSEPIVAAYTLNGLENIMTSFCANQSEKTNEVDRNQTKNDCLLAPSRR